MMKLDIQVQELQRIPKKMNPKRPMPRYIIIKMNVRAKDKERILTGVRERHNYLQGNSHKNINLFSTEAFQIGRDCHEIFKMIKSKDL